MENTDLLTQLTFDFDIELPPNTEEEISKIMPAEMLQQPKISPAMVPDEEFIYEGTVNVPTVDEILKMVHQGATNISYHEFLSDIFECGAIAISNKFDLAQRAKNREERYLQIMKKYNLQQRQLIAEIFAKIFSLLSQQINPAVGFDDYLGKLYMMSETGNSKAGQFFTPYSVSKCCAKISINDSMVNEYVEQDKVMTLNEPACGAGGMIIAAADVLYNDYHFNIARNLLVYCSDIDSRCVHMTYLQLACSGIPAIVMHQDTLTLQTWDRWETPAYIMQWPRFKEVL